MPEKSSVFQDHYMDYLNRIAGVDPDKAKSVLGVQWDGNRFEVPFFNQRYFVSKDGIRDASGDTPEYMVCVIIAKYLILCPESFHPDPEWVAYRDFKSTSHFLNVNIFASDTERVLAGIPIDDPGALRAACIEMGGVSVDEGLSYDLTMAFRAFPRISLLLLHNVADDNYPAYGTVLFQKQAEQFLDPESLVMTSACLAASLDKQARRFR